MIEKTGRQPGGLPRDIDALFAKVNELVDTVNAQAVEIDKLKKDKVANNGKKGK